MRARYLSIGLGSREPIIKLPRQFSASSTAKTYFAVTCRPVSGSPWTPFAPTQNQKSTRTGKQQICRETRPARIITNHMQASPKKDSGNQTFWLSLHHPMLFSKSPFDCLIERLAVTER
jgi:hypothetical protein